MPFRLPLAARQEDRNQRPGIAHIRHGTLAAIIPHEPRTRPHATDGGDIDDAAAVPLFLELGDCGADGPVDALYVYEEDAVEFCRGHFEGGLVFVACACVVDD